jgi:coenzyme F420-reducing hydrogenase delta subunit
MARTEPRVLIFACNWNAYEGLDQAGRQHINLPPKVRTLKVECMGQVGSSMIFKAFEKGAEGVMLVGCTPEECHYEFGSRRAAELFEETRKLAGLLGIGQDRLQFLQIRAGESEELVARVQSFVDRLAVQSGEPLRWQQPDTATEGATGS